MAKPIPGYTDVFISPVSGRRVLEQGMLWLGDEHNIETPAPFSPGLISLGEGNILVGNGQGLAEESVALKDLISRLLNLRYELSLIEENATFILQRSNPLLKKAQALNKLPSGILKHTEGIISIATLNDGQVYVGDVNNQPQSVQTIALDNLPNLAWQKIWRGNLLGRPTESDDLTQAELQIKELQGQVSTIEAQLAEIESWQTAIEAQLEEIVAEQLLQQQEIATLQLEFGELQAVVGEMQIAITTLQTEVAALQVELAALQGEIAALGASLGALQAEVTGLGATVAGLSLTVGLNSAAILGLNLSVASLNSSISSINQRLDTIESAPITLIGDVIGVGTLSTPIVTTFKPDPVFTGGALTVPVGSHDLRPLVLMPGMIRYNNTVT